MLSITSFTWAFISDGLMTLFLSFDPCLFLQEIQQLSSINIKEESSFAGEYI